MQETQETGFDPWVRKIPSSRKWHPTALFLPGKFLGQRSLVGYSPWGYRQLDATEHTHRNHIVSSQVRVTFSPVNRRDLEMVPMKFSPFYL